MPIIAVEAPIHAALLRRRRPPMPLANGLAIGVTLQLVTHPRLWVAASASLAVGPSWAWALTMAAGVAMLECGLVAATLGVGGGSDRREELRDADAGDRSSAEVETDRDRPDEAEGSPDRLTHRETPASPRGGPRRRRSSWRRVVGLGLPAALVANGASELVERVVC